MNENEKQRIREILGGKTLVIEGNISVGKSIFMERLAQYLEENNVFQKVNQFKEKIPIEILERFDKDKKKYSLFFQATMMINRLTQTSLALEKKDENEFNIVDTGILRELAFSLSNKNMGFMTELEYNSHMNYFNVLFESLRKPIPHFLLLLEANPEKLLERIKRRSRSGENELEREYLIDLTNSHKEEMSNPIISNSQIKKIIFCTDESYIIPKDFIKALFE